MKGRKPIPTEILEHRKGKLYNSQGARAEVTPKPSKPLAPRVPKDFDSEQRKVWNRIKSVLKNYGVLNAASEMDMHILVVCYLKWQEAEAEDKYNKASRYLANVFRAKQNLGLSNTDMAKIGSLIVSSQKKKSEMEALLD